MTVLHGFQAHGDAYFLVDDVDVRYGKFRDRGVVIHNEPADTPRNTREMIVVDPDGNRLRFAGPIRDAK